MTTPGPRELEKKLVAARKAGCYGCSCASMRPHHSGILPIMDAPARPCARMPQFEARARVLEEWFRLPESRRLHATDAVAFAFRLLQDRPEMFARERGLAEVDYDVIVGWLLPYLNKQVGA